MEAADPDSVRIDDAADQNQDRHRHTGHVDLKGAPVREQHAWLMSDVHRGSQLQAGPSV